jgi:uncharacterized membrane protein (DUF106 family)
MVSTRTIVLLALITAIASTACAGSTEQDEGVREAQAAIEAANAKFSEAFARGDAKALSRCIRPTRSRFRQTVK